MIELEGTYYFPNQWPSAKFTNPKMNIDPVVNKVDPEGMTIDVRITFLANNGIKGEFEPDINPVPVNNLNYDGASLVERILDRLEDFKVFE